MIAGYDPARHNRLATAWVRLFARLIEKRARVGARADTGKDPETAIRRKFTTKYEPFSLALNLEPSRPGHLEGTVSGARPKSTPRKMEAFYRARERELTSLVARAKPTPSHGRQ
jgi:hypothetical protein